MKINQVNKIKIKIEATKYRIHKICLYELIC